MASWRAEDLKKRSARVPAEVEALLAQDFPSKDQVGICWSALRDCYASEAEAITAARRYPSLVLPYMNTPSNIVGCYGTLVSLLGVQGAREVCVKNPAVLGNNPSSLSGCTAQDVRNTAELREFVDTKLPFGLRAWTRAIVVLVVAGIGAALLAPAPSSASISGAPPLGMGSRDEHLAILATLLAYWSLWAARAALTFDAACAVGTSGTRVPAR